MFALAPQPPVAAPPPRLLPTPLPSVLVSDAAEWGGLLFYLLLLTQWLGVLCISHQAEDRRQPSLAIGPSLALESISAGGTSQLRLRFSSVLRTLTPTLLKQSEGKGVVP